MAQRISKAEHKKRLELYNQGLNDRCIAEVLGLDKSTIRGWRINNGLSSIRKHEIDPIEHEKRLSLYTQGLSDCQIAKRCGRSHSSILYWRQRYELLPNYKKIITDSIEHEKRLSLYKQGLSDGQIAKQCGVARTTICHWRKIHNFPPNRTKQQRTSKYMGHADEIRALAEASHTQREIASELGIPEEAVKRVIKKRGIKRKPITGKCVECGEEYTTLRTNRKRCDGCIHLKNLTYYSITDIRSSLDELAEVNMVKAEQLADEIEREEGKEFRDWALDGVLENVKKRKSNES